MQIAADFLTNPGRGELARECQWNNWQGLCDIPLEFLNNDFIREKMMMKLRNFLDFLKNWVWINY